MNVTRLEDTPVHRIIALVSFLLVQVRFKIVCECVGGAGLQNLYHFLLSKPLTFERWCVDFFYPNL